MGSFFWRLLFVALALSSYSAEAAINRLHLGSQITSQAVTFRVYSSRATRIEVDLYSAALGSDEVARIALTKEPSHLCVVR